MGEDEDGATMLIFLILLAIAMIVVCGADAAQKRRDYLRDESTDTSWLPVALASWSRASDGNSEGAFFEFMDQDQMEKSA